jgi:hypothetical protein
MEECEMKKDHTILIMERREMKEDSSFLKKHLSIMKKERHFLRKQPCFLIMYVFSVSSLLPLQSILS